MPAEPRGWTDRLPNGQYVLRYRDNDGRKQRARSGTGQPLRFASKSKARAHFRDVIASRLQGDTPKRELTFREFVPLFLERHAVGVRTRTVRTLAERLGHPADRDGDTVEARRQRERNAVKAFGDIPLGDLERMVDEIVAWQATLPVRSRHGRLQALRQCLDAAQRWGYVVANPAKLMGPNPKSPRRVIRPFTDEELAAIAVELVGGPYALLPEFASATGLRPEEWLVLERTDIDRRAGVINVRRTVSDRTVVELAKTDRSRRQIPLTRRALAATPGRIGLLFPAARGGLLNIDNFRRRVWAPAIEASGVRTPARIYDMRATFASRAISAGIGADELARLMGTSVTMIEEHYGILLGSAVDGLRVRLDAFDNAKDEADDDAANPPR